MTGNQHIRHEVEQSLREASDRQLLRVMSFIDRLPSRHVVEDIVHRVRGRLALVRPARPVTVPRVLTLPLEDLLVDPAQAKTSPWVVPRDLLLVVHNIVINALPRPLLSDLEGDARQKAMDDRDTVLDIGQALWPAGAAAMRAFLTHGVGLERLGTTWKEEYRPRCAGIAEILEHAADITMFLDQLPPKPMGTLRSDEQGAALSLLYSMLQNSNTLFRYCYAMLMRRSAEPSQIFALVIDNDFDLLPDQRDRMLAESASECLSEIDSIHDNVESLGERSVTAAAETTLRLVSLIESLERAPSSVKVDAKLLSASKARASKTIIRTLESSLGGEMRRTVEEFVQRQETSDEQVAAAEAVARSTKKIELAGIRLGLTRNLENVLSRELGPYRDLLVRKLQKVASSKKGATVADIMDELRLIEIVFGPDVAIAIVEELRA